jgi:hypothetical protein
MKLQFSRRIFAEYSNIRFNENPSGGSRVYDADGRTDTTKLIVAFRNFANVRKMGLKKIGWEVWTGFMWLRKGPNGGNL